MCFSLLDLFSQRGLLKRSFQKLQTLGFLLYKTNILPNPRLLIFNKNLSVFHGLFKRNCEYIFTTCGACSYLYDGFVLLSLLLDNIKM